MTLEEAVRDYTLRISSSLHELSDDNKLKICGYLESWPPALLRQLYVGGAYVAIMTVMQHTMTRSILAYSTGMEYGRPFIDLCPIALKDELDAKADLFSMQ